MRLDHALLKSHVYENPRTRLRLDAKVEELGKGANASWFWIQIEDRDKNAYLDHFLTSAEALHLACTVILEYRGNLEGTAELERLKENARAIIEKLEGGERGEEE